MHILDNFTRFEILAIAVNALVIGLLFFKMIQRGGVFNGLLFDARVTGTVGVVESKQGGRSRSKFKVHVLERDGTALAGIEWSSSMMGEWSIEGVTLTQEQKDELEEAFAAAVRAIDNRLSFSEVTLEAGQNSSTRRRLKIRVSRDDAPSVDVQCARPVWRWAVPQMRAALTPQQARELGAALARARI